MKKVLLTFLLTIFVMILPDSRLLAQNDENGWKGSRYHYGTYCTGPLEKRYGERRAVRTEGEARRELLKYFSPEKEIIGEIKDRGFFFEAEIKDKDNKIVDKVIIDKRTGRIRSIY
jgi:hypothetical protein